MSLVKLYVYVDDFCQIFEPRWTSFQLSNGIRQRKRKTDMPQFLYPSEMRV